MKDTNALALEIGHTGPRVIEVQNALIKHGYPKIIPDGVFGKQTFKAVIDFQTKNGLVVDGVVGPLTASKLTEVTQEPVQVVHSLAVQKLPIVVKNTTKSMNEAFGDFRSPGFDSTYLTTVILPPAIFHDGKQRKAVVHKLIAPALEAVVADMVLAGLKFYSFDGSLNKRLMRGSKSKWSTHAWAASLDFDAALNPMGSKGKMDTRIVAIFDKHGFYWLGRRKRNSDPMHWQAALGYE